LEGFGKSDDGERTDIQPLDDESESGGDSEGGDSDKVGVIYARVSSQKQADNYSIDAQIERMGRKAEELDISLPYEPVVDRGQSAKSFDQDGPKKIFKMAAEDKITHLLVVDEDRVGRDPPEAFYYVWRLRKDYGVKLVTSDGEADVQTLMGLIKTNVKFLSAGISNRQRAKSSLRGKVQSFKEQNWVLPKVPPGYAKDGDGWIEKKEEWEAVIRDIFHLFLEFSDGGVYKKVAETVNQKYSNILSESLDPRKIKRILKNSVYIGKPKITGDMVEAEYDGDVPVPDPDLAYVTRDTFDRVQEKIRRIREKHSSSGDKKVIEINDLVEEFGFGKVMDNIPELVPVCPECGERMVKNGQRKLGVDSDLWSQNWICRDESCRKQKVEPNKENLEKIRKKGVR
ncbi:hypothetical protein AKJ54_01060, partial [candidate division MSBL1 archaeon SCGC-AAA382K21]